MGTPQPSAPVVTIGTVVVDASMNEIHSSDSEITEHPIEDGADIADHCHLRSRRFQIEGIITNQPINLPYSQVSGVSEVDKEFTWEANPRILGMELGGGGLIGTALGAISSATGINQQSGTAKGFSPDFDRIIAAHEELMKLRNERQPIDIITSLEIYENMIIESYVVDRNKTNGSAMRFSMVAVQIRTVETEFSVAPPIPSIERGKPEKNRGKKTPQALDSNNAADAAAATKANEQASLLSQIF
jgi:hypothetical protein